MIPIFEQGHGQGIGHSFDTFVNRFIEVCERKIREGNHHSFAFIFYDFNNNAIKDILRTQGGFTKLDRLASKNLSVFFYIVTMKKHLEGLTTTFLTSSN